MKLDVGKQVLIGGAGFVGSHLIAQLVEAGAGEIVVLDNFQRGTRQNLAAFEKSGRVKVVEGNILDLATVQKVVDGADGVYHLAASWLLQCVDDPPAGLQTNVVGTFNVMHACHLAKVRRLVFSSSASVYGNALKTQMA